MNHPSIEQLHRSKTGKVSDKWSSYLPYYDRLFSPLRFSPVRLLEIGRSEEHTSELQSQSNLLFRPFFFNDPATTEIYPLSLHDALPISSGRPTCRTTTGCSRRCASRRCVCWRSASRTAARSEERRVGEEGRSRWSPDR